MEFNNRQRRHSRRLVAHENASANVCEIIRAPMTRGKLLPAMNANKVDNDEDTCGNAIIKNNSKDDV